MLQATYCFYCVFTTEERKGITKEKGLVEAERKTWSVRGSLGRAALSPVLPGKVSSFLVQGDRKETSMFHYERRAALHKICVSMTPR